MVDNCEVNGVLGPVAGAIGCMMAIEAIKLLTNLGKVLDGELLVMRFDDHSTIKMKIEKESNLLNNANNDVIQEITKDKLIEDLNAGQEYLLIDIRNPNEYNNLNIDSSMNVPIEDLHAKAINFPTNIPIVLICEVGKSSLDQIRMLKRNKNHANLINLKGGINEWFNKKSP